ncbi:hypothetical protein NN561_015707 [Cricetulus griseus]
MAPLSSILGRPGDHRESSKTLVHARFLDPSPARRCPDSPHTISSRTISSVATNTSRVSPTLCHILRAGGWARAQQRAAEWLGGIGSMGGGRPRAAPPQGAGLGGAGADRGGDGPQTCPSAGRGDRVSGGAGREAPLPPYRSGEPGPRRAEAGGERTRCHGGHRSGEREPREVPSALGDARCQPLPETAAAAPPLPAPSPAAAHHQAPTPRRFCRCAGPSGKWSAKLRASCGSPPDKELQFPELNSAQGFALLSFSLPLCLWCSEATTSEQCWLGFSKSLCLALSPLPGYVEAPVTFQPLVRMQNCF